MKIRHIVVIKQILEDKTTKEINFACNRKDKGPFITETDLEFSKEF